MSEIDLFRWGLAIAGLILLLVLVGFARADKRKQKKRNHHLKKNSGQFDPYVSDSSLRLDLTPEELKALSKQMANSHMTDDIFKDVDQFYHEVVNEKNPDEGLPSSATKARRIQKPAAKVQQSASAQQKSEAQSKSRPVSSDNPFLTAEQRARSVTDPNNIPLWLKDKNNPEQQQATQNQKKLSTVSLFKNDLGSEQSSTQSSVPEKSVTRTQTHSLFADAKAAQSAVAQVSAQQMKQRQAELAAKETQPTTEAKANSGNHMVMSQNSGVYAHSGYSGGGAASSSAAAIIPVDPDAIERTAEQAGSQSLHSDSPIESPQPSAPQAAQPEREGEAQHKAETNTAEKQVNTQTDNSSVTPAEPMVDAPQQPVTGANSQSAAALKPAANAKLSKAKSREMDISFYLVADKGAVFPAAEIAKVMQENNLELQDDGKYYLIQDNGFGKHYVFSVCAKNGECDLSGRNPQNASTRELWFQIIHGQNRLGRLHTLDLMLRVARTLQANIGGDLMDLGYCQITDLMVTHLRRQVQEFDLKHSH